MVFAVCVSVCVFSKHYCIVKALYWQFCGGCGNFYGVRKISNASVIVFLFPENTRVSEQELFTGETPNDWPSLTGAYDRRKLAQKS